MGDVGHRGCWRSVREEVEQERVAELGWWADGMWRSRWEQGRWVPPCRPTRGSEAGLWLAAEGGPSSRGGGEVACNWGCGSVPQEIREQDVWRAASIRALVG